MWRSPAPLLAGALALGFAVGGVAARSRAQGNPLPPGQHIELVIGACIICHAPEILAQQRLDRATWEAIVDRMITYGAPIPPEQRPLILEYLVTRLGP